MSLPEELSKQNVKHAVSFPLAPCSEVQEERDKLSEELFNEKKQGLDAKIRSLTARKACSEEGAEAWCWTIINCTLRGSKVQSIPLHTGSLERLCI